MTAVAWHIVTTPAVASAEEIALRIACTVGRVAGTQVIECTVDNAGTAPALELWAELWRSPSEPTAVAAELPPLGQASFSWQMVPAQWIERYRQVAAVRLRYRNALGEPASMVLAIGEPAPLEVVPPSWPDRLDFALRWHDDTTPPAGTVHWWGPGELAVLDDGGGPWNANAPVAPLDASHDAAASDGVEPDVGTGQSAEHRRVGGSGEDDDERAQVRAALSPSSRIQGWNTSLYAIIVPDPQEGAGVPPAALVALVPVDARQPATVWQPSWGELAAYAAACLLAWAAAALLVARSTADARRRLTQSMPWLVFALGFGGVILAIFPLELLTLGTTPAGGDYPGHLAALDFLTGELLPSGAVYGWFPFWFGGLPLFVHYFPSVFLLAAGLGAAFPTTVALRLAGLAGTLLLPAAWFLALRWLKAPRPAAWCAAMGSLWFLLVEEQTVWGGNLASTMSGEIAYALAFPLAWLALAWAWNRADRRRGWAWLAVLLALTGASHAYPLVFVAAVIPLLALAPGTWRFRAWNITRAGLLAFGLLAWWLVPLLWNLPWAVAHRENWPVRAAQAFPPVLWPAFALAAVGVATAAARRFRGPRAPADTPRRDGLPFLLLVGLAGVALYELAYSFGLQNMRMLPFAHGAVVLLAAWQLGAWLDLRGRVAVARPLLTAAVMALMCAWAVWHVDFVPAWARWNLNGLERAPWWADYSGAMELVAGDVGDPGVIVQFDHDNDLTGSERAFELIPHFAGRTTPEGLYIQSAPLAPAVYYVQSELTRTPSCPIYAYDCGDYRPEAALAHLRVLGIDTVIAYTRELDAFLARDPAYYRRGRAGVYSVYQLAEPVALVEPARHRPAVSRTTAARAEGYDWLRAGTDLDVPLVIGAAQQPWPQAVDRYRPRQLEREPYESLPSVTYEVESGRIDIGTDRPGHPLIVKAAYHPGWRADDDSTIEMIAPGLMLVTPSDTALTLRWSSGAAGTAGLLLSVLTAGYLGWHALLRSRPRRQPPLRAERFDRVARALIVVVPAAVATFMYLRHPPLDYARVYADGVQAMQQGDHAAADAAFARLLEVATPHRMRDDAALQRGVSAAAAGRVDEARALWRSFLQEFAVSPLRAEALVRLAELDTAAGDTAAAREALERALREPLAPPAWLERARGALGDAAGDGDLAVPRGDPPR